MNILFVETHSDNPFDVTYGAVQRTNQLIRACAQFAHVDVVVFSDKKIKSDIDNCDVILFNDSIGKPSRISEFIRKMTILFIDSYKIFGRVNHKVEDKIDSVVEKGSYDKIVVRYIPDAIFGGLLKYGDRLIVDVDDNPVTIKKYYLGKGPSIFHNLYRLIIYRKSLKMYEKIIHSVNHCFFSNQDDVIYEKSTYLPNIPYYSSNIDYCDFSKTKNRIIFVGYIDFLPNFEGLTHFLKLILPQIRKRISNVEISIVGKCSSDLLKDWSNDPGVKIRGFVEDLNKEYEEARVAIVPIYSGAGTSIKVLEAFRMKRPCVTTIQGARGHQGVFQNNVDFFACESDKDFANKVVEMLSDQDKNVSISKNAYSKVEKYYSKEAFYKQVKDTICK